MEETKLKVDLLFAGLTRPATIFGVPYMAAVGEFLFASNSFILLNNFKLLLMVFPLHAVLYLITAVDQNRFSAIGMWMKVNLLCVNRRHWQASSFSAVGTERWEKR